MKLTKAQTKAHHEAMRLINDSRKLTPDEVEFCFRNYHPGAEHNQTVAGAFFTPYDYAFDLAAFCSNHNRVVDVCAGIGVLAHASSNYCRIGHLRCVELNPEWVRIGKRLVPEAEWIRGDVMDPKMWGENFDYAVSNPPFGKCVYHFGARPWAGMMPFHLHIAKMSLGLCDVGAIMIIPDVDHSQENKREQGRQTSLNYKRFLESAGPDAKITPCSVNTCREFIGAKGMTCMIVDVNNNP